MRTVRAKTRNGHNVIFIDSGKASIGYILMSLRNVMAINDNKIGIQHFYEHMVFDGVRNNPMGNMMSNDLIYLPNGYISHSDMSFYGFVDNSDRGDKINKSIDFLYDIVMNPVFDTGLMGSIKDTIISEESNSFENAESKFLLKFGIPKNVSKILGSNRNVNSINIDDLYNYRKSMNDNIDPIFYIHGFHDDVLSTMDVMDDCDISDLRKPSYSLGESMYGDFTMKENKNKYSRICVGWRMDNLDFESSSILSSFIDIARSKIIKDSLFSIMREGGFLYSIDRVDFDFDRSSVCYLFFDVLNKRKNEALNVLMKYIHESSSDILSNVSFKEYLDNLRIIDRVNNLDVTTKATEIIGLMNCGFYDGRHSLTDLIDEIGFDKISSIMRDNMGIDKCNIYVS